MKLFLVTFWDSDGKEEYIDFCADYESAVVSILKRELEYACDLTDMQLERYEIREIDLEEPEENLKDLVQEFIERLQELKNEDSDYRLAEELYERQIRELAGLLKRCTGYEGFKRLTLSALL